MSESPQTVPRRQSLLVALKAVVVVTLGALLYPVARFLRPRRATNSGALQVVAPYHLNELRPDAQGHWPPPFNFGGKPCLLIRSPNGEVKAFNAVCTHVQCTVEFRPEQGDIFCNCHNGVYDLNGRNISGPPPRPLEEYQVALRGTPGQEEIIVSRNA